MSPFLWFRFLPSLSFSFASGTKADSSLLADGVDGIETISKLSDRLMAMKAYA